MNYKSKIWVLGSIFLDHTQFNTLKSNLNVSDGAMVGKPQASLHVVKNNLW